MPFTIHTHTHTQIHILVVAFINNTNILVFFFFFFAFIFKDLTRDSGTNDRLHHITPGTLDFSRIHAPPSTDLDQQILEVSSFLSFPPLFFFYCILFVCLFNKQINTKAYYI